MFYGISECFEPFGGHEFYFGDVQKLWFLRGFGFQEGEKIGQISVLKVFQHSRNINREKYGRISTNIGPKIGQHGGQDKPT